MQSRLLQRRRRAHEHVALTSYPQRTAQPPVPALMTRSLFAPRDASSQVRQRFGRAISLDVIERALRAAFGGSMRDITDLSRETISTDPHLASVLGKRFRPLMRLPVEVAPAKGFGLDEEKAAFYALVVREQFDAMDGFTAMKGNLAWGLWDGRACSELTWLDVADGPSHPRYGAVAMGVAGSTWIHPRRLSFGPERELRVVDDGASYSGGFRAVGVDVRSIPYKFLWWTPQLFGDYPEREGLGQPSMYWSFFKRFGARERMILCELYGKPWRWIETPYEVAVNAQDLLDADRIADSFGASFSGRMPRGLKLHFERPDHADGTIHRDIIKDSNEEISKLVLGQIGTTQGAPAGLNSNQGDVMSDEQTEVLAADAELLSEVYERLGDWIIAVNFGPGETTHAPKIELKVVNPKDFAKENTRLKGALEAGLKIRVKEAYEATGFTEPAEGEAVVQLEKQQATGPFGAAPPSRGMIVPGDGQGAIAVGARVSVQPGSEHMPEHAGVPGTVRIVQGEAIGVEFDNAPGEVHKWYAPGELEVLEPAAAEEDMEPEGDLASVLNGMALEQQRVRMVATLHRHCEHGVRCVAQQTQPETANGSPETILKRSLPETNRLMNRMVEELETSVRGLTTPAGILAALARARAQLDVRPLGRALERRMVHAVALGAVDADWEEQDEENEPKVAAAIGGPVDFSALGFDQMEKLFRTKRALNRATYDRLSARAKQRAFTVAGVMADQAIATVQDELGKQIAGGASLSGFGKAIRRRMEDAGFLATMTELGNGQMALSASHVETVFRTNVLGAYNAGRAEQMRQPEVLARRPVWEIRATVDGHSRETHKDANGVMLLATDKFWQRAYPPFGFNCFVPGTLVEGQFVGASKALYAGKLVELTTAEGRRLTVTANHPVLTARGMRAAHTLREGDDLVCYRAKPRVGLLRARGQRYEHEGPATAEQVFGALAHSGLGHLIAARDDFHGEAQRFRGEVEVVGTYRQLLLHAQAAGAEHAREYGLEAANPAHLTARSRRELLLGAHAASGRGVSSGDLSAPLLSRHASPLHQLSYGSTADLDALLLERAGNDLPGDAELGRKLLDGLPGEVVLDELTGVRQYDALVHVHDLQTTTGILVAGGIITSNCRCRVVSRGPSYLPRVVDGSTLSGLPDDGFTSGLGNLIAPEF